MGLFFILLLIMGSFGVLNYRISKQISGTGRAKDPVFVRAFPQERVVPGEKKETRVLSFDSDPLAPVVAKKPPLGESAREEPLKKVYEAVPRSGLLAN